MKERLDEALKSMAVNGRHALPKFNLRRSKTKPTAFRILLKSVPKKQRVQGGSERER